ncbi:MAG: hypothetical protein ABH878_02650, partial [bacterium]
GAAMVENSEVVYALNPADPFEPGVDYTMDYAAGTLTALTTGSMLPDSTYYLDFQFTIDNYYVFSFAPTVHWVGYDADGFVDHYQFADISDTAFIAGFRDAQENGTEAQYFAQNANQITWTDTTSMEARIYLLTTEGDTTEHLFFIKAVDNLNVESQGLVYKTYYRSNNAPDNPEIKPLDNPESDFSLNFTVDDTLFCPESLTPLWQGINFNWRSSDPDDKELYQIPLEFAYYLIHTPGDTIWAWSNPNWSNAKQIQLFGLETGSYMLTVWCRDDGYTLCSQSATISFNVIKPTFQYHILVVDETINSGTFEVPGDSVAAFYQNILTNLADQLDNDSYVMDGVDVYFKNNSNSSAVKDCPIPYALIGQYKLVLILDDDHVTASDTYIQNRTAVMADYLDVGGRLWHTGRKILLGSYSGYSQGYNSFTAADFVGKYFQLETGFAAKREAWTPSTPDFKTEFEAAVPVLYGFPELEVDSAHVAQMYLLPPTDSRNLMMDVDWFTRSDEAATVYTFYSVTADTEATDPYIEDEDSPISSGSTPIQCKVIPLNSGLLAVDSVYNSTKGVLGQVISFNATEIIVSYPYSEPWVNSDVLRVDYTYDPISENHLKPVAVRYESQPREMQSIEIQGSTYTYYTYTLGYRTSLFTFPLYFVKNDQGQVEGVFKEMLDWFFFPTIH